MKFYLFCFAFLFCNYEMFAQSNKHSINFNYGEFVYQYVSLRKGFVENQGKTIDTSIVFMTASNFGEVLTYYCGAQHNHKQAKLIRINSDSVLIGKVQNKLDTALLVLSYLQVNMFDKNKVYTSVPYSGFFGGKNATYRMVGNFNYLNLSWNVSIYFKRGIINHLTLSIKVDDSTSVDFGKFKLLKSRTVNKPLILVKRTKKS